MVLPVNGESYYIFKWCEIPEGLFESDPTGSYAMTNSPLCADFPDVCCCILSESISRLLVAASQPVSFCCIFRLAVVKCGSKHKGEKKIIIAFDTRCEAEQLFVRGGQLLSSLPFLLQISTDLPFQPLLSEKLSLFLKNCEQTCGVFYILLLLPNSLAVLGNSN